MLLIAAVASIVACVPSCSVQEHSTNKGILVDNWNEYPESSAVTISSASVDGNKLTLKISCSGNFQHHQQGKGQHEFRLLGSRSVAESLPPQRRIMLHHRNNGDHAEALIQDEITFDITDFADSNGSEIYLILDGYQELISYTRQ